MENNNKNYEQLDMLEYIHSNGKIKKIIEDDNFKVQENNNIEYKIPNTDEPNTNIINESIQNNEFSNNTNEKIEEDITNYNDVISKEEYEDLCLRYANGENLKKEDLIALKNATIYYMNNQGKTLKQNQNGFTKNFFMIYIVFIVVFIVLALSIILFKVK